MAASFNFRHLRAFSAISATGSVSAAAEKVFLSQPAITQAIAKLERALGTALFLRKNTGMFLTEAGTTFLRRVDRALDILANGTRQAGRAGARSRGGGFDDFDHLLTHVQLRAFLALCRTGNYSWAASEIGIARPSIHRAINDMERISGFALFSRAAQGVEPTQSGQRLRKAAMLAYAELDQGLEEVRLLGGRDTATISIGSLPLARSEILPAAINRLSAMRPEVQVKVRDGSYADLLHALRYGEIDMLIGALRHPQPVDDVVQAPLFVDRLMLVVRAGHPLVGRKDVDVSTLSRFPWVTPSPTIPTRQVFDNIFAGGDATPPSRIVETSSMVLIRGLLLGSDRITIISQHQIAREISDGLLSPLEFEIPDSERDIGLTTRSNWLATGTQGTFINLIEQICSAID